MEVYNYSYGSFTRNQIADAKAKMRKKIFFLLLIVDPETADNYESVDVNAAFESMLDTLGGLNGLLNYPQEFVEVMALIYAAYLEYQKPQLNYPHYRKLILDAGNTVKKIKEVTHSNAET